MKRFVSLNIDLIILPGSDHKYIATPLMVKGHTISTVQVAAASLILTRPKFPVGINNFSIPLMTFSLLS